MNGIHQALERITVGVIEEHKVGSSNILSLQHIFITAISLSLLSSLLNAYDLDDKLSIGGITALSGQCQELTNEATAIADVYYTLENYDRENPEATPAIRMKIAEYVKTLLDREQNSLAVASSSKSAWERYTPIEWDLIELQTKNAYQKDMRTDMLKDWDTVSNYRRSYQAASARKIPAFFWVMAILGFAFITIPFHAFSPKP